MTQVTEVSGYWPANKVEREFTRCATLVFLIGRTSYNSFSNEPRRRRRPIPASENQPTNRAMRGRIPRMALFVGSPGARPTVRLLTASCSSREHQNRGVEEVP